MIGPVVSVRSHVPRQAHEEAESFLLVTKQR